MTGATGPGDRLWPAVLACVLLTSQPGPAAVRQQTSAEEPKLATVNAPAVREVSGIVASRNNPGVLWVHNDSGDSARVYAINGQGSYLGAFAFSRINVWDCEDIAIGPGPVAGADYLYLGDIGDNRARRREIFVYRVAEPVVYSTGGDQSRTLFTVDKITLKYPDGPRDAETLLCDPLTGDLLILTKVDAGNRVYRAPAPGPGERSITLEYKGSMSWPVVSNWLLGAVAGDVSPAGNQVLVKNYTGIFLYDRPAGTDLWDALTGSANATSVPYRVELQGEAVSFDATGRGYYTLSEGANQPLHYYHCTDKDTPAAPAVLVAAESPWERLDRGSGDRSGSIRFRRKFQVENATHVDGLTVKLVSGGGVVVYLNGTEIARTNFADSAGPSDLATDHRSGRQDTWIKFDVEPGLLPGLLLCGTNTLEVEIQHGQPGSSNLNFDLQLLATGGTAVPEPAAFTMLAAAAVVGLLVYLWRRRKRTA